MTSPTTRSLAISSRLSRAAWCSPTCPDFPCRSSFDRLPSFPQIRSFYYLAVFEDGNGDKFVGVDGLERIAAVANVPIYTWHISGLDRGIVGGSLISMEALARRLAELALRVLGGERADAIAITEFDPNVVEFDWRQLQRWQVDERRLPSGSVVRFRQPTTWQRYKAYIITAVAVLGLQTMFIAGLLFQRARRRRVEAALRQNQQRYALATAAGAVGVWDWNLETNEIYVDPSSNSSWGSATRRFATARRTGDHGCIRDDREVAAAGAGVHRRRTDVYEIEHRMLHKDGSVRWFLSRGSVMQRRRWHAAPHGRHQGGHHRTQARRRRDSRERGRPGGQPSGDPASGRPADRGAGSRAGAHRARSARRREPAARRLSIALSGLKRRVAALPSERSAGGRLRRSSSARSRSRRTSGTSHTTCIPTCCGTPGWWPPWPPTAPELQRQHGST